MKFTFSKNAKNITKKLDKNCTKTVGRGTISQVWWVILIYLSPKCPKSVSKGTVKLPDFLRRRSCVCGAFAPPKRTRRKKRRWFLLDISPTLWYDISINIGETAPFWVPAPRQTFVFNPRDRLARRGTATSDRKKQTLFYVRAYAQTGVDSP